MDTRLRQRQLVNNWIRDRGGVWGDFDPVPRVLPGTEFTYLESGLIQRINALNQFLCDIYADRMIIRDGVIPEEFVYSSPAYRTACLKVKPVNGLYAHLSAEDLLREADGKWYVVEDDLQTPADCAYPHLARKLCRSVAPEQYELSTLCDNCGLNILLNQLYTDLREGMEASDGIVVVLDQSTGKTPFEVSYLAELTGSTVAKPNELTIMDDSVYYRSADRGGFQKVAVIHRMEPDRLLDPLVFESDSLVGVPHLMEVYRRGKVAIVNAPGCGVTCDRGLYYFVPDMIRYYLREEPILPNVPTFLPWKAEDRDRVLDDLINLIVINVTTEGRGSIMIANRLTEAERERLREAIRLHPRHYVAQKTMKPVRLPTLREDGKDTVLSQAYFRSLTVYSNSVRVWMGGSTRYGNLGAFQDTWVLSE